ncbi:dihydrofolate reductase family protein [Glutamicibacter protophormiae]|uniref:Dihydrofolate reductase n=1 Tax=Glutamicibacter protophormiae TaxID=37930 RepID=A0ABS4XNG4_GLUPR|nr:dihydrofolate reductase family protein [Glutamicibacter protophormiae]MBP2397920.1 dihydrofolate reductase [Glutamicibacter protophormiae]QRQ78629.1 dihydrofolate reductase family protein [Glutamicibacter protophormiae]GGL97406.1 deaminase reductase [Glutamicibacter protophormiae]
MSATYTFDVFSSLDGFGSAGGDWGGYWGKQGPELLERRLQLYTPACRMVYGANTFRLFERFWSEIAENPEVEDPWGVAMHEQPATVVSTTLAEPLAWPDAVLEREDALAVVARLKAESPVPLRSHGSLAMNHSLLAAGLVDFIQVTVFPVLTGRSGASPVFAGVDDYDLELVDSRLLDGSIQELTYRPTRHG